ncbi:MAG: peptide deformylase [Clostridia bacterium]|nr:peptide deformylase [Clostridia bacterium]
MKMEELEYTKDILKELKLKNKYAVDDINNVYDIITVGNDILRSKNDDVDISQKEVQKLIINMVNSLYYWNGCGIAAPQVGKNLNIFIVKIVMTDENEKEDVVLPLTVFVNPKILEYSKDTNIEYEGCLSISNYSAKVERSNSIKIEYQDIHGKKHVDIFEGFAARAVQHEYDHLQGIVYTDIADMKTFTLNDNLDLECKE